MRYAIALLALACATEPEPRTVYVLPPVDEDGASGVAVVDARGDIEEGPEPTADATLGEEAADDVGSGGEEGYGGDVEVEDGGADDGDAASDVEDVTDAAAVDVAAPGDAVEPADAAPDVCASNCDGKDCGWDGCGKSCGTCIGTDMCTGAGQCKTVENGKCTFNGAQTVPIAGSASYDQTLKALELDLIVIAGASKSPLWVRVIGVVEGSLGLYATSNLEYTPGGVVYAGSGKLNLQTYGASGESVAGLLWGKLYKADVTKPPITLDNCAFDVPLVP